MFQSGLAGLRVDGDELRVERAHEQRVAEDRHAAVVGAAADLRVGRRRVAVEPEDAARSSASTAITSFGRCVRYMTPSTTSGVDCQAPNTWFCSTHFDSRLRDVGRRDLGERAVALARVGAAVGQPVVRLAGGAAAGGRGVTCASSAIRAGASSGQQRRARRRGRSAAHCDTSQRQQIRDQVGDLVGATACLAIDGIGDVLADRHRLDVGFFSTETSRSRSSTSCTEKVSSLRRRPRIGRAGRGHDGDRPVDRQHRARGLEQRALQRRRRAQRRRCRSGRARCAGPVPCTRWQVAQPPLPLEERPARGRRCRPSRRCRPGRSRRG